MRCVVVLVPFVLFVAACTPPTPTVVAGDSTTQPQKSVVPTPRTWNADGMIESFRTAARVGKIVSLPDPVDWFEAAGKPATQSKSSRDFEWNNGLVQQNKLDVFIQMDPYKTRRGDIPGLPPGIASASFADPTVRKAFIADAVQRAKLYHPPYICLAMEINAYYEQRPADFDNFVSLFREARAEVKKTVPDAVVFVSFQYEQLLGRFGGQGDLPRHAPHWELFQKFEPDIDAIGITSYPVETFVPWRFGDPARVAEDYYAQIGQHTSKPVIFAELGWATDSAYGGSPNSQESFLRRFPRLIERLDVRLVNWFLLYDATGFGPQFQSMGLFDSDGKAKPAFAVWKDMWNKK